MNQYALFENIPVKAPLTQGIKYAGSKQKLLPYILQLINKVSPKVVLDGFAGTTRVSQALAQSGYQVISNDISVWSEVFGNCYLMNKQPPSYYIPILEHLNQLQPIDGWYTEHYGGEIHIQGEPAHACVKHPWQKHNTRKLDAIRDEIVQLKLPFEEECVLLTSLILALDQVDSTIGHYASYLKDWSPRSHKTLTLTLPNLFSNTENHKVYRKDIFDLLPQVQPDLAYFDPPYGSNNEKMPPSRVRYSAYYHIWTTICLNDKPELFGKANRRKDSSDKFKPSPFEEFRKNTEGKLLAVEAIENLIKQTNAQYIVLSYSSGGRATAQQLHDVLQSQGKLVDVLSITHKKNVMAEMKWTNEWTNEANEENKEFFFLLEKQ